MGHFSFTVPVADFTNTVQVPCLPTCDPVALQFVRLIGDNAESWLWDRIMRAIGTLWGKLRTTIKA